jgi:hypothetical protein
MFFNANLNERREIPRTTPIVVARCEVNATCDLQLVACSPFQPETRNHPATPRKTV